MLPVLGALGPAMAAFGGAAGGGMSATSATLLSGLIGGGLSMGGGLLSGLFGKSSAQDAMDFQEKFAQNKYKWMVNDLKQAGLNPLLAVGASPGGLSGGFTSQMPNVMEGMASAAKEVPLAIQALKQARSASSIKKTEEQTAEIQQNYWNSMVRKTGEEAALAEVDRRVAEAYSASGREADINWTNAQAEAARAGASVDKATERVQHAAARRAEVEAEAYERMGPEFLMLERGIEAGSSAARGIADSVGKFIRGGLSNKRGTFNPNPRPRGGRR